MEIANPKSPPWSYVIHEVSEPSDQSFQAISIAGLMKKYDLEHIDILKMDIEGSEKEIFSDDYKSWLSKVRVLIVEFHDHKIPDCTKTFFKALDDYSYRMRCRGENVIVFFNHSSTQ